MIPYLVAGAIGASLLGLGLFFMCYRRAQPNEALIVSGRRYPYRDQSGQLKWRSFRIIRGESAFIFPIFERSGRLFLGGRTAEVRTNGPRVGVDALAQFRVMGDEDSIARAAEYFLTRTGAQIQNHFVLFLDAHIRTMLGQESFQSIDNHRAEFAQSVQKNMEPELNRMGIKIESLTIRDVFDPEGYLENPELDRSITRDLPVAGEQDERAERLKDFQRVMRESGAEYISAQAQKQREQGQRWKCTCGNLSPASANSCTRCGMRL